MILFYLINLKKIRAVGTSGALLNQNISSVMWKTVSESCNLACDYCYYSGCNGRLSKIDEDVLEKFIREYMDIKRGVVPFSWQGGELYWLD